MVEAGGVLRSVVGNGVAKIISNAEVGQNLANRRSDVDTSVARVSNKQTNSVCEVMFVCSANQRPVFVRL